MANNTKREDAAYLEIYFPPKYDFNRKNKEIPTRRTHFHFSSAVSIMSLTQITGCRQYSCN